MASSGATNMSSTAGVALSSTAGATLTTMSVPATLSSTSSLLAFSSIFSTTPSLPVAPVPPSPSPHPALSVSNIKSHVPKTLDFTNYLLWQELFLPILTAYDVMSHVDGTPPPSAAAPSYVQWQKIDSLVLSWIQSTVSRDILQSIITPGQSMTAYSAWNKTETLFRDHVESRIVQLRQEFYSIKKGDHTMREFLLRLKDLYDCRLSVGVSVSTRDLLLQVIKGLGPEYNTITSILSTMQPPPTFDQMKSMLFLEETKLQAQRASAPQPADHLLLAQQPGTFGSAEPWSRPRGPYRRSSGPWSSCSFCPIYSRSPSY